MSGYLHNDIDAQSPTMIVVDWFQWNCKVQPKNWSST